MTRPHPKHRGTAHAPGTAALLLALSAPVPASAFPIAPASEVPGTPSVPVPASCGPAAAGGTAHHIAVLGSGCPAAACGQDVATAVVGLHLALGAR